MEGTGTGEKPLAKVGNSILIRSMMEKQYLDEDEFEAEGKFRDEDEIEFEDEGKLRDEDEGEFEDEGVWIHRDLNTAGDGEDDLDPGDDDEEGFLLEDYDEFEVGYLMHLNRSSDVISTRGKRHLSVWRVT